MNIKRITWQYLVSYMIRLADPQHWGFPLLFYLWRVALSFHPCHDNNNKTTTTTTKSTSERADHLSLTEWWISCSTQRDYQTERKIFPACSLRRSWWEAPPWPARYMCQWHWSPPSHPQWPASQRWPPASPHACVPRWSPSTRLASCPGPPRWQRSQGVKWACTWSVPKNED